jgi:hypothetical protein
MSARECSMPRRNEGADMAMKMHITVKAIITSNTDTPRRQEVESDEW